MGGQKLTKKLAESIIEQKKQLLVDIGINDPDQIEDILTETYEEYQQHKTVKRLRNKGLSYPKIANEVGIDKFKVFNWIKKQRFPNLFANERFFSKNLLKINEETQEDVNKLLAVYSAAKISPNQTKFKTKFKNRTNLELVMDPFFNVFSTVPDIFSDKHGIEFDFCSKPFLEYYNEHTLNNTAIPWQLLNSYEKKVDYFKYFFLRKGLFRYNKSKTQNRGSIVFSFHNNRMLLEEFASLLFDINLIPRVNKLKVEIVDYVDLRKILVHNWCLCPDKKKKLRKLVSKMPKESKVPLDCILVALNMQEVEQDNGIIAEFSKSDLQQLNKYTWAYDNMINNRLKAYLKLKKLEDDFNGSVVSYFYQTSNSISHARSMARVLSKYTLDKLIFGSEIIFEKEKSKLAQEFDITAWINYSYSDETKLGINNANRENDKTKQNLKSIINKHDKKYILADYIINMYLPKRSLDDISSIKIMQLQIYRVLRTNPRFFQFTILENEDFYFEKNKTDFVESLIGSMYRKERRFNDSINLTKELRQQQNLHSTNNKIQTH